MDLLLSLVYASYRANRERSPHISPERWRLVYQDVAEHLDGFEHRYQYERRLQCLQRANVEQLLTT